VPLKLPDAKRLHSLTLNQCNGDIQQSTLVAKPPGTRVSRCLRPGTVQRLIEDVTPTSRTPRDVGHPADHQKIKGDDSHG
jgi:hypothetical protein